MAISFAGLATVFNPIAMVSTSIHRPGLPPARPLTRVENVDFHPRSHHHFEEGSTDEECETRDRVRVWRSCSCLASRAWPTRSGRPLSARTARGDRIILIGNTLAERMQYFGNFETLLQSRFPDAQPRRPRPRLVGRRADAPAPVGGLQGPRPHPRGREARRRHRRVRVQRVVRRPGWLDKFRKDLEKFIVESTTSAYNGKATAEAGDPALADRPRKPRRPAHHRRQGEQREPQALRRRDGRGRCQGPQPVVVRRPLLEPDRSSTAEFPVASSKLTINGIHLNEVGRRSSSPRSSTTRPLRPSTRPRVKADMAKLKKPRSWRRTSSSSTTTGPSTVATSTGAGRPRSAWSTSPPSSPSSAR